MSGRRQGKARQASAASRTLLAGGVLWEERISRSRKEAAEEPGACDSSSRDAAYPRKTGTITYGAPCCDRATDHGEAFYVCVRVMLNQRGFTENR